MLRRIYVHNYRSLVGFEWRPPMACVIVGENGAGKSALFEVLVLLQDVIVHGRRIEETGFPSTRTAWLDEPVQRIEIDLERSGELFTYRLEARVEHVGNQERTSIAESLSSAGQLLYRSADGKVELFGDSPGSEPRTTIPFDRRLSFLAAFEPGPDNRRIAALRDGLAEMWMIKPDPLRLEPTSTGEATWLERDLGNFSSWYRRNMQEDFEAATRLHADLVEVLPAFAALRLEYVSPQIKDLRVRFDFGGRIQDLSWTRLSEGQRLIIALYGVLRFAFERAELITLDEVENYVAPAEIQPWLRAVADVAAEGGRQLMVISHHPESIDYLAADSAWKMWRDPATGASRIARLEPDRDVGETAYDLVRYRSDDG